jgi:hypothetical protein
MSLRCPYLTGKYFKSCSVSKEPYVPSAFEMEEYCISSRHSMCPFYGKRQIGLPKERRSDLAGMRG